MTPKESLVAARELLADPAHHTTGSYYKGPNGEVNCAPEYATCFCAVGALFYVNGVSISDPDKDLPGIDQLIEAVGEILHHPARLQTVFDLNDNCGHAEVLRMFDRAIELA